MTGKVLFLVAVLAICDAAVIPMSHNWLSPRCRTRKEMECLSDCCGSDIDYNRLFNELFPGTKYDTIGGYNFDGCTYDRSCCPADYFGSYPEVRACRTCPGLEYGGLGNGLGTGLGTGLGAGLGTGLGAGLGYEGNYGCECWPKCMAGCVKCELCYRRSPRGSFPCEKMIGPCYPEPISCV